ncbi:MAG: alpha/beta hydrolase [Deltaproteobacteria bacterium]|nr:alpha/beta hydrolase [Deltaproteobacteria bacterium]
MVSFSKKMFFALSFLYLGIHLLFFIFQRKLLFPNPSLLTKDASHSILQIPSSDGRSIYLLISEVPKSRALVLHFHGNAEIIQDTQELAEHYKKIGISFVAMEYAGYGLAHKDSISENKLYDDAEKTFTFLKERFPNQQIVLEGQSIGTGIAVELAKRGYGQKLILFSPYSSVLELARAHYPFLIFLPYLALDRFENRAKTSFIKMDTLIVHGKEDEIVPFQMGAALHSKITNSKLLALDHTGHNDLFLNHTDSIFLEIENLIGKK